MRNQHRKRKSTGPNAPAITVIFCCFDCILCACCENNCRTTIERH